MHLGKKVSGIKRHIAVDTQGLPHAIAVMTADVTDREGALIACRFHKTALSEVNNVPTEGGDTGLPFADAVHDTLGGRRWKW